MTEPVTLVAGGYLFKVVSDVAYSVVVGRADARVQAFLDRRINPDVQDALRKAWKAACAELFQRYRQDPGYRSLLRDEREFVNARGDLFVTPRTIDDLFPLVDPGANVSEIDVGRLFDAGHDEVNRVLLDALKRLGLIGDLPGGLERQIRASLLYGLLFHFVEIGIKRDGKARDALFFDQLIAIRRGTAATEDELRAIHTKLEQLDGCQQWQRQVLTDIAADTKATRQIAEEIKGRLQPQPTTALHSIPHHPLTSQVAPKRSIRSSKCCGRQTARRKRSAACAAWAASAKACWHRKWRTN